MPVLSRPLALLGALACWSCFNPDFGDGKVPCATDRSCPPGLTCGDDSKCHVGLVRGDAAPADRAIDGLPADAGCTSSADCDDRNDCTTDTCDTQTGACSHQNRCCQADPDCDDQMPCTMDTCDTSTRQCKHLPQAGCCTANGDCDDMDLCTVDACETSTHMCSHTMTAGCCTADSQCSDGNVCTTDACNTSTHTCSNTMVAGCCNASADCNDGNVCTTDTCNTAEHTCGHAAVAGCCNANPECDDANVCTTDTCNTAAHTCGHAAVAGCCNANADCNDGNVCTTDLCDVMHQCNHTPVVNCCNSAADCDDGRVCTTDTCNTSTHQCAHMPVAGCCMSNADCNDNNACNGVETCNMATRTCVPGTALNCNDNNACTTDSCNPASGCVNTPISCNDNNVCTTDSCNPASGCVNTPISCDDGDICTVDGCNFASGCQHTQMAGCAARPNDTCANAIDITNTPLTTSSTLGAYNQLAPLCQGFVNGQGADVFYKFTLTQSEIVYLDLFGSDPGLDTVLYVLSDCNGTVAAGGAACNDDSYCNAVGGPDYFKSQLVAKLQAGTYYVDVDTFGSGNMGGAFQLTFRHSGPACAGATAIANSTLTAGNTCSGSSLLSPSCVFSTNQEQVFYFTECPGSHTLDATTCQPATLIDTVLYVRPGDCTTAGDIACIDDLGLACPSDYLASGFSPPPNLPGANIYYLVVDTYGASACGPFEVNATYLP